VSGGLLDIAVNLFAATNSDCPIVTLTSPVLAPGITNAVNLSDDRFVIIAGTPPILTDCAYVKSWLVIVTRVPTGPLLGVNEKEAVEDFFVTKGREQL